MFLETLKGFSSPTRALAKCAWYHEEFAFLQVRWPNGHQNTYRHGAEGACDLLIHPAVSLLICTSIHPFVRSFVRIFRSCHPYVRLIRSFPGFTYSKRLEVSSFSLPSPSSCLFTVNCLLSARGGGGEGSNCPGYGIYIIFSMIYILIRVEIRLCMCVYIWISIVNTSTIEINYASEIPR